MCPGRAFANYAEGGKSALLIKLRLPEFQNTSARRVFMLMGLSDAWQGRTADAIAADFRSIAETMKTGGREVTIVSVLLPNLEMRTRFLPDRPFDRAVIDALNARLPAVAREIGARFADVNSVLAPRGELLADFTYDGVHLTDEAYAVLARTIGICG